MSHRVPSAFKLVYGHLNSIFLTGNFAWAFAIPFANSGQKDFADFKIFNPCTLCGKTLLISGGVYLPAFWATLSYYLLFGPHILYNCYNGGVAQKAGNRGVWPKKQVNKPLLKPATFCRTLCRGQNLRILPCPFGPCLQNIWRSPTQNCRSKRCCLGDPIPI